MSPVNLLPICPVRTGGGGSGRSVISVAQRCGAEELRDELVLQSVIYRLLTLSCESPILLIFLHTDPVLSFYGKGMLLTTSIPLIPLFHFTTTL